MRKGVQELFIYSIEFYDEEATDFIDDRNGIITAKGFADAMLKLEQYYGKECIVSVRRVYELDEVIEIDDLLSEVDKL